MANPLSKEAVFEFASKANFLPAICWQEKVLRQPCRIPRRLTTV